MAPSMRHIEPEPAPAQYLQQQQQLHDEQQFHDQQFHEQQHYHDQQQFHDEQQQQHQQPEQQQQEEEEIVEYREDEFKNPIHGDWYVENNPEEDSSDNDEFEDSVDFFDEENEDVDPYYIADTKGRAKAFEGQVNLHTLAKCFIDRHL
jgi:hypothetical protein